MKDRERRLAFTREELAESTVTERIELEGVDVESVHRTLEQRLADQGRPASFEDGVRSRMVRAEPIESPDDGRGTRRIEGRLSAVIGRAEDETTIEYRPYGPHGAMAMVLGAIFALPTLFVTLLLVAVGYALYRIERSAPVPLERVTTVDVLVTVPATEADERADAARADGSGTVEVVAAAEPGYAVDSGRVADLEWPHRKSILAHVRDWKALALEGRPERETVDDVFFGHLNMCWKRNAPANVDAIDEAQREVFADREGRAAYADRLGERSDRNDGADATADIEALLADLPAAGGD